MKKVIVYTMKGCRHCDDMKKMLSLLREILTNIKKNMTYLYRQLKVSLYRHLCY